MEDKKIIIWISTFVLCIAIGFGVTKLINSLNAADSEFELSGCGPSSGNPGEILMPKDDGITDVQPTESGSIAQAPDVNEEPVLQPTPEVPILETSKAAAPKTPGKSLSEEISKLEKQISDIDAKEAAKVNRMSASDFQRLLLDQNDSSVLGGKNPKVARTVSITVKSLRDGDKKPGDILAVREKIANGIWTSASVSSVNYDSQGRVNSVVIIPNYPD